MNNLSVIIGKSLISLYFLKYVEIIFGIMSNFSYHVFIIVNIVKCHFLYHVACLFFLDFSLEILAKIRICRFPFRICIF